MSEYFTYFIPQLLSRINFAQLNMKKIILDIWKIFKLVDLFKCAISFHKKRGKRTDINKKNEGQAWFIHHLSLIGHVCICMKYCIICILELYSATWWWGFNNGYVLIQGRCRLSCLLHYIHYLVSIYPFAHKQLRRHLPNPFREFPCTYIVTDCPTKAFLSI